MSARVGYALDNEGKPADADELMKFYGSQKYRRFHGQLGNTARRDWTFFSDNGEPLFVLTDLGNRDLIQISISGNTITYRFE